MIDYAHLKTILAVEREGSYEAAARKLNVTATAVSRRVRAMENLLGVVLVNREGRARPTETGYRVCRFAEANEHSLRELLRAFSVDVSDDEMPLIRVVVNHDSLATWFVEVLEQDANSDAPRLYELIVCDPDRALDYVRDGHASTAISSAPEPMHGHSSRFLGAQTYRAVASHDFSRRQFPDGPKSDRLHAAPALGLAKDDPLPERWLARAFEEPPEVQLHAVPCGLSILEACRRGVGWAMIPSQLADPLLRANELSELQPGTSVDRLLYWHFSAMTEKAILPVTRLVMAAAIRHLGQSMRKGGPP